jgi:hypothetical protein
VIGSIPIGDAAEVVTNVGPDWDCLIRYSAPTSVVQSVKAKYLDVISITNAAGTKINLDYWAVTIGALPKGLSPVELLENIRVRFAGFQDPRLTRFWVDGPAGNWMYNRPGTILRFEMPIPTTPSAYLNTFPQYREAPVALAESGTSFWRFVTLSGHPVSGTREFGIFQRNDGQWEVYTCGVDRVTFRVEDTFFQEMIFQGGDQVWEEFQGHVAYYVQSVGGTVTGTPAFHKRYDWDTTAAGVLDEFFPGVQSNHVNAAENFWQSAKTNGLAYPIYSRCLYELTTEKIARYDEDRLMAFRGFVRVIVHKPGWVSVLHLSDHLVNMMLQLAGPDINPAISL